MNTTEHNRITLDSRNTPGTDEEDQTDTIPSSPLVPESPVENRHFAPALPPADPGAPFTITWEAIPSGSTAVGEWLVQQPFDVQAQFTDKVGKGFEDELFARMALSGLHPDFVTWSQSGLGAYDRTIRPNVITLVSDRGVADAAAAAIAYVRDQQAVPWFRARVDLAGCPSAACGVAFTFAASLTSERLSAVFMRLRDLLGDDVGFTRVSPQSIALINFRGSDGTPFLTTDISFLDAAAQIKAEFRLDLSEVVHFGSEGKYVTHPSDCDLEAQLSAGSAGPAGSSGLLPWLRDWREHIRAEGVAFARARGAAIDEGAAWPADGKAEVAA